MRMTLSISAALVALWLAYAISPFVAAYRLVGAVADRDAAALSAGVDFRAVRASLGEQIARTYLRITGKAGAPGSLREQLAQQLAVGVAASVADQILVDLVSPQGLLDFLRTGAPPDIESDGLPTPAGLSTQALGNVWRAYLNSELGIARFFLDVPVDKPRQESFRLQFCLRDWAWKLCGLELPEVLQVRLAQELVRRESARPRG
ncbi:MAG TPA: DUF2939 domain-containing protein [Xanthobacteraceae bacterium]|nr:DUF2939 domain-containing protein [Xanthobacteraceae bacterium]